MSCSLDEVMNNFLRDVKFRPNTCITPVLVAVLTTSPVMLKELLDANVNTDILCGIHRLQYPLEHAVDQVCAVDCYNPEHDKTHYEATLTIVKMLLEYEEEIDDHFFLQVILKQDPKLVELALQYMHKRPLLYNQHFMHYLTGPNKSSMEIIKMVLSPSHVSSNTHLNNQNTKCIDLNNRGLFGRTLLIKAAAHDDIELVKYLIELGADIHTVDEYNDNCLHVCGDIKIMKILLEAGVNPNPTIKGTWSMLHSCVADNSIMAVKLLLEYNVDTNVRYCIKSEDTDFEPTGQTPLDIANSTPYVLMEIRTMLQNHTKNQSNVSSQPIKKYACF